jgi:hypothetical protein
MPDGLRVAEINRVAPNGEVPSPLPATRGLPNLRLV